MYWTMIEWIHLRNAIFISILNKKKKPKKEDLKYAQQWLNYTIRGE